MSTQQCTEGFKFTLLFLEQKCRPHLCSTNDSWRVDETYIQGKGKGKYLYRAVDSTGNTLDFLRCAKRERKAAKPLCVKP